MRTSPFCIYRDMVLGQYSTAAWLRSAVMAMWNGQGHQVGLSQLTNLDIKHYDAFIAMVEHYRAFGENDQAFMALAEEIQLRMADEKAAENRAAAMEDWQRQMLGHSTIGRQAARYAIDDFYSWLEGQFDAGMEPSDAMRALESKVREREGA